MIASHLAVVTLSFLLLALQCDIAGATPLEDGPQRRLIIATIPDNPLSQVGMPLLEQIYQKVGVAVEFRPIPPARATNMLMRGQLDGVLARFEGFERQAIGAIKVPVSLTAISLVAFAREDQVARLQSGKGRPVRVGLLRGLSVGLELEDFSEPMLANTTEQLMELLQHRRIDVAIDVDAVGAYFIRDKGLDDIRIVSRPLRTLPVYHYLQAKHRNLLPELTLVMQELKDQGLLDAPHQVFLERLGIDSLTLPADQLMVPEDLMVERLNRKRLLAQP